MLICSWSQSYDVVKQVFQGFKSVLVHRRHTSPVLGAVRGAREQERSQSIKQSMKIKGGPMLAFKKKSDEEKPQMWKLPQQASEIGRLYMSSCTQLLWKTERDTFWDGWPGKVWLLTQWQQMDYRLQFTSRKLFSTFHIVNTEGVHMNLTPRVMLLTSSSTELHGSAGCYQGCPNSMGFLSLGSIKEPEEGPGMTIKQSLGHTVFSILSFMSFFGRGRGVR